MRQIAAFVAVADINTGARTQKNVEEVLSFDLIAGDASPRKYYRVALSATGASPKRSLIAVDARALRWQREWLRDYSRC